MAAKKRILLIDDEPSLTRLLKLNLERTGAYEVKMENRGTEGLAAARDFQPDVIVLDVIMPDRGGVEVAREIQSEDALKHVPIVFLTAIVSNTHARSMGGYPVLPKPISMQDLLDCIERQLGRRARHP